MALLAARWYETGTFWSTVAGAAVTLLLGVLGARAARLTRPRRRITWHLPHRPAYAETDLRTLRTYRAGDDTATLTMIRLANTGSRAVTSEMYDAGKPVLLDLRAEIREISSYESRPPVVAKPPIEWTSPTVIAIGPGLVAAGQRLDIAVVTAGPPALRIEGSLIDVPLESAHPSWWRFTAGAVTAFAGGYLAVAAAAAAQRLLDGGSAHFGRLHGLAPVWQVWQHAHAFTAAPGAAGGYLLLHALGIVAFGAGVALTGSR